MTRAGLLKNAASECNGSLMKVTIITTVYNRVVDLDKTIQSVLQFARPGLDYIVIDGGSTDGSVELIRAHSGRLVHWHSEPDDGVYDAMNKGWAAADPDSRVIFLGAGDLLLSLPDDPVSNKVSLQYCMAMFILIMRGFSMLDRG